MRTPDKPLLWRQAATSVRVLTLSLALLVAACATLDTQPRAARSSAGCARAAVEEATATLELADKRAHCLGAARIAQRCSIAEAALAAYGKEVRDFFGAGDAQLGDIRAGHAGIRCARTHADASDHASCCETQGF
jgi:hypothetical protein